MHDLNYGPLLELNPPTAAAWRLEELLNAGYPLALAEPIAARDDVDLHRAVDLIDAGCAPELAAQILL